LKREKFGFSDYDGGEGFFYRESAEKKRLEREVYDNVIIFYLWFTFTLNKNNYFTYISLYDYCIEYN